MFSISELADFKDASTEAMRHHFVAEREVADEAAEPDDFGQKPTRTETVYDGTAHITDDEMALRLRTQDFDFDAEGIVQVPDWPVTDTEGLSCYATFAGVERPCRIVGTERGDVFDRLFIEFTGRGEAVASEVTV